MIICARVDEGAIVCDGLRVASPAEAPGGCDLERAGVDRGGAGVGVVAGECECAGAILREAETGPGYRAADGEVAGGDGDGARGIHGYVAGAEIQVVCADKGEVAVPILGVVGGECLCAAAGVIDRAAGDGKVAGAQGGGTVDV